jgi:hypothetical protein
MTIARWMTLFFLLAPSLVRGEEPPVRFTSQSDARLHFFQDPSAQTPETVLPPTLLPPEETPKKKSPALAALFSLVLPGMGELYTQDFSSGKWFLIAEGVLWLAYGTVDVHATSVRTDARTFAVERAGVDPSRKNDQFYVDVSNFMNTEEYNQEKLRNRELEKVYDPAAGYTWQWRTDADRSTFRQERIASEQAYDKEKFIVAAVVVNHVASAINAARAAVAHNKALQEAFRDLELSGSVIGGWGDPQGVMLSLRKGF